MGVCVCQKSALSNDNVAIDELFKIPSTNNDTDTSNSPNKTQIIVGNKPILAMLIRKVKHPKSETRIHPVKQIKLI